LNIEILDVEFEKGSQRREDAKEEQIFAPLRLCEIFFYHSTFNL
jgi:hypothetical protein